MRILYLLLWVSLGYGLRLFFRKTKTVNSPKEFFGRTIYVSNHPASFMDPLVVARLRRPIVFFMTRSDVFKPLLKPILWASHMLPIYRQHDGEDTKEKNSEVFARCVRVLKGGRNLLIFGEGFTDDVFIRSLKPVKKGAARIGFIALEQMNWEKKLYLAAVGINYSDPQYVGGDVLVATSNKILLNDYKELYDENPAKAITTVTREIERLMQEQITYVERKEFAPLHEQITRITRRGLSAQDSDSTMPLEKRWTYSRELAQKMNETDAEKLTSLQQETNAYFAQLKRLQVPDRYVYEKSEGKLHTAKELFFLVVMIPPALLGFLHGLIPYLLAKKLVEKSFRRKVFWSSVKLLLGMLFMGLYNIPFIFLFYHFIYPSYWLAIAYYCLTGLFGYTAYMYIRNIRAFKTKSRILKTDISALISRREELRERIRELFEKG